MYTKLHTDGLVIRAHDVGEADRLFDVYTRALGMVTVRGRGVRHLHSRQRYALQQFSLIDVSVVRSRTGWRVTNVSPRLSFLSAVRNEPEKRGVLMRIARLFRRLVVGEEKHEELFDTMTAGFAFICGTELSGDDLRTVEALTVLRMLRLLGYVPNDQTLSPFYSSFDIKPETLATMRPLRSRAVKVINDGLAATHL